MGRSLVGMRVGAALAAIALVAGPIASPAVSANEPRGEQAWWYTGLKIGDAHTQTTGKGVVVALADTPIAPDVPELKGQDVTAVANFCGGKATGSGKPADHGSMMASLIVGSGKGAGAPGVAGIAPDATLRTYAYHPASLNGTCLLPAADALGAAVDAAVEDGARIINVSGGTHGVDADLRGSIEDALAAGVVIVAAAGQQPDDPQVIYPAAIPGVVAVAAIDRNAKAWTKNVLGNHESFVISAPGVDIPAAGFNGEKWDSTEIGTGTSQATALVSGGLALIAAKYPKATGNQLIQHLIHNPGGRDDFGKVDGYGYGIMSVTKMLASDPTQWPDENPLIAGPASGSGATPTPAGDSGTVDGTPVASKDDSGGGVSPVIFVVIAAVVLGGGAFAALRFRKGGARG